MTLNDTAKKPSELGTGINSEVSCMCKYCDTSEYVGEKLPLVKNIDGRKQNFELYVFSSPEDEGHVLEVNGEATELRVEIKYCPMCGRRL